MVSLVVIRGDEGSATQYAVQIKGRNPLLYTALEGNVEDKRTQGNGGLYRMITSRNGWERGWQASHSGLPTFFVQIAADLTLVGDTGRRGIALGTMKGA